jgi:hypothetical protein
MSIKQSTVLNGLIIALVFVSGCGNRGLTDPGPGKKHGMEDNRSFRIYIYADPNQADQCLVDWPQATLWTSKHHEATWVSDDGGAYTVDFTNLGAKHQSPFTTGIFLVPAGGEVHSGPLTGAPGYYDYGIKDAHNNGTNVCKPSSDPGVYVK